MHIDVQDSVILYLGAQGVLGCQATQHYPYFLEIQVSHIPLAPGSHVDLVYLTALVDLENHGLHLHQ